jgi:adenosylcobinamide-phosphate synthase
MPAYLFVIAYFVDWILGDPQWLPHPVRLFGSVITRGENFARKVISGRVSEFIAGMMLTILVVSAAFTASHYLLRYATLLNPLAGKILVIYLAATTIASRDLIDEAWSVYRALQSHDLDEARLRVGRIVGRDTGRMDHAEVVRATIETLAESASDGIVAPMFYLAIGGVPGALAYKAINTLDSMIGHNDSRYRYFGKFAARLDDVANFIPARLTAILIAIASFLCRLDYVGAVRIWFRDASKHASPNAGRPEAAMAGALGVRLGGLNYYDGEPHHGAYFGDDLRPLDNNALKSSMIVVVLVSVLMALLVLSRFAI